MSRTDNSHSCPVVRLLECLQLICVLVLAFLLASLPARNSDVWLHLASGRSLARGQFSFGVDPFLFTTSGVFGVNSSWLYDLLSFFLFQFVGETGLVVAKAILMSFLGWILIRVGRTTEGAFANAAWVRGEMWVAVVFAVVALLIVGSSMPLGPICVSYLFLALTLWLLESRLSREQTLSLSNWWPVPLLFVLWANLDAWFILGPATVGLYFLGVLLARSKQPGQARSLGLVFLAGLAACLVNPYHFRIFGLPSLFPFTPEVSILRHDPVFGRLLQSPWASESLRSVWEREVPDFGRLLYYLLVVVTAASFFVSGNLEVRSARLRRLPACLFFFALSAWDASTIPFLAIVAAPLTALNFQGRVSRRAAEHLPAPLWQIAGRTLILAILIGLGIAAWPGWLQGQRRLPRGWFVETDSSLVEAVQQVVRWRREGRLQDDETGFHFSPTAAHYFAWFAPEEKSFCAARWPLCAGIANDYVTVRRALLEPSTSMLHEKTEVRDIFRKHRVAYLLLHDSDAPRSKAVFPRLAAAAAEWPILFLKGDSVIFGWRDPAQADAKNRFASWRLDFHRRAFQPADEEKAPAHGSALGPDALSWRSSWTIASPAPSHARQETALYLMYFDLFSPKYLGRHRRIWEHSLAAGIVAAGAGLAVLPLSYLDFATFQVSRRGPRPRAEGGTWPLDALAMHLTASYDQQQDDGPPELLLLAVRAARRALQEDPCDAEAYHLLGEAYLRLIHNSRERLARYDLPSLAHMRRIQAVCAFHQALLLQPDLHQAHYNLLLLYQDMGLLDFALHHAQQVLRLSRKSGRMAGESQESWDLRLEQMEKWVRSLEENVQKRQDNYELRAARRPVLEQALLAQEQGLGGKALDILLASDVAVFGRRGAELELELLLAAGRIQQVRDLLTPDQALDLDTESYHRFRVLAAAVDGDYQTCAEELAQLTMPLGQPRTVVIDAWKAHPLVRAMRAAVGEKTETVVKLTPRQALALKVAQLIVEMPFQRQTIPWLLTTQIEKAQLLESTQTMLASVRQQAVMDVLGGVLALESGASAEAEASLRRALSVWKSAADAASGSGLDFDGRRIAQVMLEWMMVSDTSEKRR